MQKKLRITVEGKVYDVLVEDLSENGLGLPAAYPSIAGTGCRPSSPPPPWPPRRRQP
jgi:glutaconyl-CoA/methylmalonyl-CoA decarboxylase subunit gamma